jgi:hypothetical protein
MKSKQWASRDSQHSAAQHARREHKAHDIQRNRHARGHTALTRRMLGVDPSSSSCSSSSSSSSSASRAGASAPVSKTSTSERLLTQHPKVVKGVPLSLELIRRGLAEEEEGVSAWWYMGRKQEARTYVFHLRYHRVRGWLG